MSTSPKSQDERQNLLSDPAERLVRLQEKLEALNDVFATDGLRMVPAHKVLAGFGQLLGGPKGTQWKDAAIRREALKKSQSASSIGTFISHSWRGSRWLKFLALTLNFNGKIALASSMWMAAILFWLELASEEGAAFDSGWELKMPKWMFVEVSPGRLFLAKAHVGCKETFQIPFLVCPLSIATLCTALLVGHHVLRFWPDNRHRRDCFLDICCIPQENDEEKMKGALSLRAYLDRSKRMLVLVDETYFTRLWCLWEIAAFSQGSGLSQVDFVPLNIPMVIPLFMLVSMWSNELAMLPWLGTFANPHVSLLKVFGCLLSSIVMLKVRRDAYKVEEVLTKLCDFSIEEAQCYDEETKDIIFECIFRWFDTGEASNSSEERKRQIALHKFEKMVQREIAVDVMEHTKFSRLTFWNGAIVCLPNLWLAMDASASAELDIKAVQHLLLYLFVNYGLQNPSLLMVLWVCSSQLRNQHFAVAVAVQSMLLLVVTSFLGWFCNSLTFADEEFKEPASDKKLMLLATVCLGVAYFYYR